MVFRAWLWTGALVCGSLVACGGVEQSQLFDDAGPSPQKDASAQPDTSQNPPDASIVVDAAPLDAPVIDDVVTVDVPVGPPDSLIQCGKTTCSAQTQVCCYHSAATTQQYECVSDLTDCNNDGDVPIGCSSQANCASQGQPNDICCGDTQYDGQCSVATAVSCQATCDQQTQIQVGCDQDACPSGQSCKQSICSLVGYYICVEP